MWLDLAGRGFSTPMDHHSDLSINEDTTGENVDDAGLKRSTAVSLAIKTWKKQLTDLSGRNTLLYYRDLKVGTLNLAGCEFQLETLLAGKQISLSKLFSEELIPDVRKRARAIYKKAQEHYEERGIETLFLAYGTATWDVDQDRPVPRAPVLLQPAVLIPKGSGHEEYEIRLTGEMLLNETLLHLIETEFGIYLDQSKIELDGAIDTIDELNNAIKWLSKEASAISGFRIEVEVMLGTFSYMKLPMVRDIEEGYDLLFNHDLVSAIAGDDEARRLLRERYEQVRVSLSDPNLIPPADEFLILDADASQNYAINAILGGQDLIIQGPPGTGKSQTIANLIATLAARGKRILFVAEKRAAIDAVLKRIDGAGLSDLIFDLHGGVAARRQIAQELARSLDVTGAIPLTDYSSQMLKLERRRCDLKMRTEAFHEVRTPWGISVHDAQVRAMGVPAMAKTDVRLRGEVLQRLHSIAFIETGDDLFHYAGLGGLDLASTGSFWAGARITSQEEASNAIAWIDYLQHHVLRAADKAMNAALTQCMLPLPNSIGDWKGLIDLWAGIDETLSIFSPEVFTEDLSNLLTLLEPATQGRLRRFQEAVGSAEYRHAKKTLRSFLKNDSIKTIELVDRARSAHEQATVWHKMTNAPPAVPGNLDEVQQSYKTLEDTLLQLRCFLPHLELEKLSVDSIDSMLSQLRKDQATLRKLPELHKLNVSLVNAGLGELIEWLGKSKLPPDLAKACFEYVWLQSIIEGIGFTDALVGTFDGEQQSKYISEFIELDEDHLASTATRIKRQWAEKVVIARDSFPDQGAQLKRQASRKRKLMPFRQLFTETKDLLLALKPCWVMSPLVVSQSLPSELLFDVVIFDEASQIRPPDAIPAIARGKQLVVAGDKRQLPPTTFFDSALSEDEEEDAEVPVLAATEGFESILENLDMLLRNRMLTWHYRSHDERLIAFSNAYLYDRSLTTFPGISSVPPIEHILVPFELGYPDQETSVSKEVDKVVNLVLQHAEERPHETLGVIAMGIKHANRIDEALRLARTDRQDLEEFFSESKEERFFVKNLERVQGDERDSIILSVGYGKSTDGRMLYRFGPINNQGGERRLNVAVTRARRRVTLVSSFSVVDIDPDRLRADGAKLLRAYLQYAEHGGSGLDEEIISARPLNPFEIDVRDTLTRRDLDLVPQLGVSGYWIDFAVKHPKQQGRYILAIECDGASYHSIPTVRDRDRLRQEQLERLGWRFHRIWSTDWISNKEKAVDAAVAAYELAIELANEDCGDPQLLVNSSNTGSNENSTQEVTLTKQMSRPIVPRNRPITYYSRQQLISIIRWIESDTLLRTNDELLTQVMKELGFSRRGQKS